MNNLVKIKKNENHALVFIDKNDVFTNSKIIAKETKIKNKSIVRLIEKYKSEFLECGEIRFWVFKSQNLKGGRPEKIVDLNEEQALILMTYLKNTEIVRKFKRELIRQFLEMRDELRKRQAIRPIYLESRRTLTDSIQALPDSPHKKFKYKHYTDLIYKLVIGKTSSQIRKELGLSPKKQITNFLTAEQMEDITKLEQQAATLLDMGFTFEQIKSGLIKFVERSRKLLEESKQIYFVGV